MRQITLKDCNISLVERILNAARRVHETHGAGLLGNAFQPALLHELTREGLRVRRRPSAGSGPGGDALTFRADLVVEDCLLLELASNDLFGPTRISRIMTRPELSKFKRGYELNLRAYH
jgi:GxxExxY protein